MKTNDQHFADWESYVFGYGYGSGEEHIIPVLKTFMEAVPPDTAEHRNYDYNTLETAVGAPVAWLLLNALCHADIIEYGTSPRFGWLTNYGYALKDYVGSKSVEELLQATDTDSDYIECYPDVCNCDGEPCHNPFWRKRHSVFSSERS